MENIVNIDRFKCFFCDRAFNNKDVKKTKHHAIPQFLKPKNNVTIAVCEDCHKKITDTQVTNYIKPKASKELKEFKIHVDGLIGAFDKYGLKLKKVKTIIDKDIAKIEGDIVIKTEIKNEKIQEHKNEEKV